MVALRTGITLMGKTEYHCHVRRFTARRPPPDDGVMIVVKAHHELDAACEAAKQFAKSQWTDGERSFVHEQRDGSFFACVGQQSSVNAQGIVTHGMTVRIVVKPNA